MRDSRHNDQAGFTLAELMIVVAILAILASLAVPNLLASGARANESATIANLRSIASAQFRFKAMSLVDRDLSGSYEYGTFTELAGTEPVRTYGERIRPGLLGASFGTVDGNGRLNRQGYFYALYLPDAGGVGVSATLANASVLADPAFSEIAFSVVAWPASYGNSGTAAFFVNQEGEILRSTTARYSGAASIPAAGCAMVGTASPETIIGGRLPRNGEVGSDGNTWRTLQ